MKAVESSTVVAFRALVMLACLIVVPMAAIFGSACPDMVRSLLIEPLLGTKMASEVCGPKSRPSPPSEGATPNPGHGPAIGLGAAPAWSATEESLGLAGTQDRSGATAPLQPAAFFTGPGQSPPQGTQARFDAPADSATSSPWPRSSGSFSDSGPATASQGIAATTPHDPRSVPDASGGHLVSAGTHHSSVGASSSPSTDRFSTLERRLREYGAIYYLLETWGNEGELYRFHCKMAIANNPNYTRHFEATHREAMQAMTQVLEQIEAWRAGRLP